MNVRQENKNASRLKKQNDIDYLQKDSLSHSVSQPNIRNGKGSVHKSTGKVPLNFKLINTKII